MSTRDDAVVEPNPDGSFSHLDAAGHARMVDVSQKATTTRTASARAVVELTAPVRAKLLDGDLPKGDALGVARFAGIQAAKETSRLIPLCHPLALSAVDVAIEPLDATPKDTAAGAIEVVATVRCVGRTGVEMEAMAAASVAALTLYDMCKALQRGIRIACVELVHKAGGKSGPWNRGDDAGGEGAP